MTDTSNYVSELLNWETAEDTGEWCARQFEKQEDRAEPAEVSKFVAAVLIQSDEAQTAFANDIEDGHVEAARNQLEELLCDEAMRILNKRSQQGSS